MIRSFFLVQIALAGCAVMMVSHASAEERKPIQFFDRSVSLEDQLVELDKCGIVVNDGVTESDLLSFDSKKRMEKAPYAGLVEALGFDIEREPYSAIVSSLWMCDYERIEDHGAYKEILERLELMTGSALGLTDITDYVDLEEAFAWVEFSFRGKRIRWEAEVDNDWLDPYIIVKYDQLLEKANVGQRIYSNHTDYGQVAFFAVFTSEQFECFQRLSKINLALIESQA